MIGVGLKLRLNLGQEETSDFVLRIWHNFRQIEEKRLKLAKILGGMKDFNYLCISN